ncbi:hypothetical protein CUMW_231420 [Citrus unshiu]|uniref:Leucine-rich repeat-containing N-terminal plant-type domain-containing protein n=1 Tax=Citrus unshiu TaxID=55188 RepID=A0A2H5QHQ8_CITUN|nr:hypothetical protein CUMW_231420 [Citrus unshiu]
MSVFVALVFVALFATADISLCYGNSYVGCKESEREALLKLKRNMKDLSNRLASWIIGDWDCCKWVGIFCNNFTGHILELNLEHPFGYLKYSDAEDDDHYMRSILVGKMNFSLVDLKHLVHLDLSVNDFQGIQIPKYLGSLENLRYLNFSGSKFAGMIRHQLGNDSSPSYKLIVFHGYQAFFCLSISTWVSWIYSLRHLFFIVLSYNQFQGKIPSTLGNLTSLKQIDLSHNQFNFTSPGWLSKLNELSSFLLDLVSCMLTSIDFSSVKLSQDISQVLDIFSAYGTYAQVSLILSHCQISAALGKLSSLRNLDFSLNMLNGSIPLSLGQISHLEYLDLSNKKFVTKKNKCRKFYPDTKIKKTEVPLLLYSIRQYNFNL